MAADIIEWLLASDEPWTRYRTRVDLLDQPESHPDVQSARAEMTSHPKVQALIEEAAAWPGYALKRHNDPANSGTIDHSSNRLTNGEVEKAFLVLSSWFFVGPRSDSPAFSHSPIHSFLHSPREARLRFLCVLLLALPSLSCPSC